jgi:uncharacterized protein
MKKILLILLFIAVGSLSAVKIPRLQGRVNDYANILSSRETAELEKMLIANENATSTEIVVLTVKSLDGEPLETYSMKVAEAWKIGKKEFDNGLLLLIAMEERAIRIEVGYGLEAIITDMKSGYIIRNYLAPYFQKGQFYNGIYESLKVLTSITANEFDISEEELARYQKEQTKSEKGHIPVGVIIFILFIVLSSARRGRGGLLPMILLGSAMRGSGRSGFGGSSGGFGGFSGGGGNFGGGGASGGW